MAIPSATECKQHWQMPLSWHNINGIHICHINYKKYKEEYSTDTIKSGCLAKYNIFPYTRWSHVCCTGESLCSLKYCSVIEKLSFDIVKQTEKPAFIYNTTILGKASEIGIDLIMITSFWSDQSWFLEIMQLATELLRHFQHSQQHLWIVMTEEASQKFMRDKKHTVWRLMSLSVSEII